MQYYISKNELIIGLVLMANFYNTSTMLKASFMYASLSRNRRSDCINDDIFPIKQVLSLINHYLASSLVIALYVFRIKPVVLLNEFLN